MKINQMIILLKFQFLMFQIILKIQKKKIILEK